MKVRLIGEDLVEVTVFKDGKDKYIRRHVRDYKNMSIIRKQRVWQDISHQGLPEESLRQKLLNRFKRK